jgi:hypothetical protein
MTCRHSVCGVGLDLGREKNMSERLITIVLTAAYAPLGLMVVAYLAAFVLKLFGRDRFLRWLVERTSERKPETPRRD